MKHVYKITACAVALALAVSTSLPVFAAANEVSKDENVFVMLNADGSVQSQTVSCWLHSDSGLAGFTDTTSLEDVVNLKGNWQLTRQGDALTLQGSGNDVYYQGTTQKMLPVTADITYTLNGAEQSASDILGQAGHVVVRIRLTNTQAFTRTIDGKQRTLYTPFVTMIAANLSGDVFTNIKAEHGTVQTDAANQLVAFVAMPGMKDNLQGLLPQQIENLYDYMLDEVTIEADTECFEMPSIMLATATSMEELEATTDIPDLDGQISELKDATQQLQDGCFSLQSGVDTLNSKMQEFETSYQTFDQGIDTALTGANQVKDGSNALADGTRQLVAGAAQLGGAPAQIKTGAEALQSSMVGIAQQYGAVKTGINQFSGTLQAIPAGMENLKNGVSQLAGNAAGGGVTAAATALSAPETAAALAQNAELRAALQSAGVSEENIAAVIGMVNGAAAAALQAQTENLAGGVMQSTEMSTAMQQMSQSMNQLTAPLQSEQVQALLNTADAMMSNTDALMASVYNSANEADPATLYAQLTTLTKGLAAFGDAPARLNAGAVALNKGAEQLAQGLGTLSSSSKTVKDVIGQFRTGTGNLAQGATELASGMTTYKTSGIDELTGQVEQINLNALQQVSQELESLANSYNSYTGAAENTKSSVKFVMKVQAPETEPTQTQPETTPVEQKPEQISFWSRVKNLFIK